MAKCCLACWRTYFFSLSKIFVCYITRLTGCQCNSIPTAVDAHSYYSISFVKSEVSKGRNYSSYVPLPHKSPICISVTVSHRLFQIEHVQLVLKVAAKLICSGPRNYVQLISARQALDELQRLFTVSP